VSEPRLACGAARSPGGRALDAPGGGDGGVVAAGETRSSYEELNGTYETSTLNDIPSRGRGKRVVVRALLLLA
jgi:hypothetical protein